MSYDLRLPEPVDLIISETLGNLVDNESCVRILADARDRLLRPGGRMLPARAQSYLVPVAAARAHASVAAGTVRGGDEAVPVETRLAGSGPTGRWSTYYDTVVPWSAHLAGPRLLRDYDFTAAAASDSYDVGLGFLATAPGTFTGFKGWFVADLSDSVTLDISGDDIAGGWASDSWKHCYLPVERAVEVRPGDRITVTVARRPAATGGFGQRYRWTGAVRRGPEVLGRFDHRSGAPGEWTTLVPAAG
jgi:protein arginine N-methyltransferase 1